MNRLRAVLAIKTKRDIEALGGVPFEPQKKVKEDGQGSEEKGEYLECPCRENFGGGRSALWLPESKHDLYERCLDAMAELGKEFGIRLCLHTTAKEFVELQAKTKSQMAGSLLALAQAFHPNPSARHAVKHSNIKRVKVDHAAQKAEVLLNGVWYAIDLKE